MMPLFDVYVSATSDETAFLACGECGDYIISDDERDDAPEKMAAGGLVMALVVHQVKHAMVHDVTQARASNALAVDAALAQLRRVIQDTRGS